MLSSYGPYWAPRVTPVAGIAPLFYADFPAGPGGYNPQGFTLEISGDGQVLYAYVPYADPGEAETVYVGRVFQLGPTAWAPIADLPTISYAGAISYGLQVATNTTGSHFATTLDPAVVTYYSRVGATITSQGTVSVSATGQAFPSTLTMSGDGLKLAVGRQGTNWALRTFTRGSLASTFSQVGSDLSIVWYRDANFSGGTNASPRSAVAMSDGGTILYVAETRQSLPYDGATARYTWDGTNWQYDQTILPTNTNDRPLNSYFGSIGNGTKLAYAGIDTAGRYVGMVATVNTTTGFTEKTDEYVFNVGSEYVTQIVASESQAVVCTAEPDFGAVYTFVV
jgi:hypothetical protein